MTVDVSELTGLISSTPAINEPTHFDNARRIVTSFGEDRQLRETYRSTVREADVSREVTQTAGQGAASQRVDVSPASDAISSTRAAAQAEGRAIQVDVAA